MIGSIRINFVFGLVGLLVISFLSFNIALIVDSIIKALIAFVVFFLFAYFVRWLLFLVVTDERFRLDESTEQLADEKRAVPSYNESIFITETEEQKPLNDNQIEQAALLVKDLLKEN